MDPELEKHVPITDLLRGFNHYSRWCLYDLFLYAIGMQRDVDIYFKAIPAFLHAGLL